MNVLGTIATYSDLHNVMRARADALEISRLSIDKLAKLPDGYAAKLLSPRPMKRLSDKTLSFVLPALGMMLVAVEDPQSLAQIRASSDRRDSGKVKHAGTVSFIFSRRWMREIQRRGGRNSRKYLSARRVKQLARKAGRAGAAARWAVRQT